MNEINEYSNVNYCKKLSHKDITHIDLPSNIIKRYSYINIHNPSYYDVELYTADPMTDRFIKPFCKIYQNSYLSVEIPSDMTLNGLFLYPVYNRNNSVDYCEDIYLTFSKHSNYWNEKGKENNNIDLQLFSAYLDSMAYDSGFTINKTNDIMLNYNTARLGISLNTLISAYTPNSGQLFKISGFIDKVTKQYTLLKIGTIDILTFDEAGYFEQIVKPTGNSSDYTIYIVDFDEPEEEYSQSIKNFKIEVL